MGGVNFPANPLFGHFSLLKHSPTSFESCKMAKKISQETYNQAVQENIDEFNMTREEAVDDAIKQFEAQGVDLTDIIKDLSMVETNTAVINNSLKKLEELIKDKSKNKTDYVRELEVLCTECNAGLSRRVAVGKANAYDIILDVMLSFEGDEEMTVAALKSMISLITGQPDLLTTSGVDLMLRYLDKQKNTEIIFLVLKWIKECCIKHEHNRQQIFNANILNSLKPLLEDTTAENLKALCAVLRSLVLDDDIRVEYGKAHEHARVIARDTLCPIITLLDKFKTDELVVSDLLITLSSLIVTNEFCKKVEDAGGLDFVLDVLKNFEKHEKINRQVMKLLKGLAGNDDLKSLIIQRGGTSLIANSLMTHKSSAQNVVFGLNTVAALTLRSPDNSKLFYEAGFPEIIVELMKLHQNSMNVQRSASWAIRNMVSRSKYQCPKFLSLGVEPLLHEALKKFKKECEYDLKAALRDLGCKVDLKEEWTGKGGKITTQAKAK